MVHGLRTLSETYLDRLPRMADFARWATACETALWPAGSFMAAYCGNRDDAVESVIEADDVATAVRQMMESREDWSGTYAELLSELSRVAGERQQRWKFWPGNSKALSNRLRRAKPGLRNVGITFEVAREGHERTRVVHITTNPDKEAMRLPATAASSAPLLNPNRDSDFDVDRPPNVANDLGALADEAHAAVAGVDFPDNLGAAPPWRKRL